MGRRTLLLLAALLLAALGTGLVWTYVRSADDRARGNVAPINAIYTTKLIPAGTSGSQLDGFVTTVPIPASMAQGVLTSVTSLQGLVATLPIPSGVPLTQGQFVQPGRAPAPIKIGTGKLALDVTLGDPQRVADFLTQDSLVTIFVTGTPAKGNDKVTKTVIGHPVKVITVAGLATQSTARTSQGNSQATSKSIVTLELSPDEAAYVIAAQASGDLYLGLLGPDAKIDSTNGQPSVPVTAAQVYTR